MSHAPVDELFNTPGRFLRSTHLERDFEDPSALDGYILTETTKQALLRVTAGVGSESAQRAWRVTSDFGTGKSSFGLLLARVLAGHLDRVPASIRAVLNNGELGSSPPAMLPILITGDRESLATTLVRSLKQELDRPTLRRLRTLHSTRRQLANDRISDSELVDALIRVKDAAVDAGEATGVLLVIDELGKFLEFAAMRPDQQDIFLLQRLAEAAARSGDSPLLLIGLLHQGIHAYARQLPSTAQQEWEKVAGRFEEILFDQPLEHIAALVEGALGVDVERLPAKVRNLAVRAAGRAVSIGWYGPVSDRDHLLAQAPAFYPLHPTALPVLVRFLARFGQHQRSLFGFLLSDEPFALRAFAARTPETEPWYRLPDLYDYVRHSFGHRLGGQSHRSQWTRITEIIDGSRDQDELTLRLLKTVALLNLLDAEDLPATDETLRLALDRPRKVIAEAMQDLRRRSRLYPRGVAGGYCLWPSTSVSLDQALTAARQALGSPERLAPLVAELCRSRSLVAGRHYIQTGTLRHFELRYTDADSLPASLENRPVADGLIVVVLCDTPGELRRATDLARDDRLRQRPEMLLAVTRPLGALAGAIEDQRCWSWIVRNTPELNHDGYAAAEVARQLKRAELTLAGRIRQAVGLDWSSPEGDLAWFRQGEQVRLQGRRELLEYLSTVCDELYPGAPRIHNELVNRHELSSAAMKARSRLIDRILETAAEPDLGLDPRTTPPEKSIYLSVLKAGGLHRRDAAGWAIREPEPNADPCNLMPALRHLDASLEQAGEGKVRLDQLLDSLRQSPLGIRDGLSPLILAVFAEIQQQRLAFYENGTFVPRLTGVEFLRMLKAPAVVELQKCTLEGVRAEIFARLVKLLAPAVDADREPELLDVVTSLCLFAARLPEYARTTESISPNARRVRQVLLRAREPSRLLFNDLPAACGLEAFANREAGDQQRVERFVETLRAALDELRAAYPELQKRLENALRNALEENGTTEQVRRRLAERAHTALLTLREPRLKAFCLRLADHRLAPVQWVEAVASFVCSKPPRQWSDGDEEAYAENVVGLGRRLRAVERIAFDRGETGNGTGVRVLFTRNDGSEVGKVLYVREEEEQEVGELEARIEDVLARSKTQIGLAATARVFWRALARDPE